MVVSLYLARDTVLGMKQEELARELDERSKRIRTLREAEVVARECGLHDRAEEYKAQRRAEEPGYGLAYMKYCRSRPAVDKTVRRIGLTKTWSAGV